MIVIDAVQFLSVLGLESWADFHVHEDRVFCLFQLKGQLHLKSGRRVATSKRNSSYMLQTKLVHTAESINNKLSFFNELERISSVSTITLQSTLTNPDFRFKEFSIYRQDFLKQNVSFSYFNHFKIQNYGIFNYGHDFHEINESGLTRVDCITVEPLLHVRYSRTPFSMQTTCTIATHIIVDTLLSVDSCSWHIHMYRRVEW